MQTWPGTAHSGQRRRCSTNWSCNTTVSFRC